MKGIGVKRALAVGVSLILLFSTHLERAWSQVGSECGPFVGACPVPGINCQTSTGLGGICKTRTNDLTGRQFCVCEPIGRATTCEYTGDLVGEVGQEVNLVMSLSQADTGRGVPFRNVLFTLGPIELLSSGQEASALTDLEEGEGQQLVEPRVVEASDRTNLFGIASTTATVSSSVITGVKAEFPGDEKFEPCEDIQEFMAVEP